MKSFLICMLFLIMPLLLKGQSFIFNQFFQPSIRINSQYNHDFGWPNKDRLNSGYLNINCILPIKSKLKLKVDWKQILSLRFKKASRIKAYQIFWNFRPKLQYLQLQYKNSPTQHPFQQKPQISYGISTGLTGIHLMAKPLKRPRFLFYNFNLGFLEDYKSVQRGPNPEINGLIGVATLKNLHFYWYYGLYLSYNNGLFIPAPFFGIQAKIAPKIWVNITIPIQLKIAWKVTNRFKLDIGLSLTNLSTPFGYQESASNTIERYVLAGFRLKTGVNLNIKLSKQTKLYLEFGCLPYQRIQFRRNQVPFVSPLTGPSWYTGVHLFYAFKKSLLSATIDGIIMF